MCTIDEIAKSLKPEIYAKGEVLYNIAEFLDYIKRKPEKYLGLVFDNVEALEIVPFYAENGKRLELYEFTLRINPLARPGFEQYILDGTRKTSISEIPEDYLQLRRACYMEYRKSSSGEYYIVKEELQKYFEFLLNNQTIASQIEKCYARFDRRHLWLEIY